MFTEKWLVNRKQPRHFPFCECERGRRSARQLENDFSEKCTVLGKQPAELHNIFFFVPLVVFLPSTFPSPLSLYINDLFEGYGSWIVQFRDIHKDNRKNANDQHSNVSPHVLCFVNPLNMQIRLIKITSSKLTKVFVLLCVVSYLSAGVAVWIR